MAGEEEEEEVEESESEEEELVPTDDSECRPRQHFSLMMAVCVVLLCR